MPNSKGQIVIPKEVREALDIKSDVPLNIILRGGGMCIYPIRGVITKEEGRLDLLRILRITQGAWANENWKKSDSIDNTRKRLELRETDKTKNAW